MICEDVAVPAKLLTFERTEPGVLDIHLDETGATELIQVVQRLLLAKENAHDHLMTSGWGGTELTDETQTEGATLVEQVNIHLWRG
jgi:Immunity protein 32